MGVELVPEDTSEDTGARPRKNHESGRRRGGYSNYAILLLYENYINSAL